MGYLFLSIALFAGATKGFCGKKISGYTENVRDSVLANIIRMVLCIVIGLTMILFEGNITQLASSPEILLFSALSGISTAVFVVTWLISVKKSAYMMLDVFLMLGVLVPLIAGEIIFNEQIKLTQWVGLAVLFVAVIIMCSYNNTVKSKLTLPALLLLLVCGISNGVTDLSQKLFVKRLPDVPASVFNFYTYIFAVIALSVTFFLMKKTGKSESKSAPPQMYGYILVMAVCLFANSYFKTLAAEHLDAVLLYPLNQGVALILSTVMSATLFHEKITAKAVVGIIIAFIGLLIINVL